jgi:hypothetical protein
VLVDWCCQAVRLVQALALPLLAVGASEREQVDNNERHSEIEIVREEYLTIGVGCGVGFGVGGFGVGCCKKLILKKKDLNLQQKEHRVPTGGGVGLGVGGVG